MTTRTANALGALVCAALLGYAYYSQYVLHLEPCPLCIFQRIGVFALGVVFMIAALHNPRALGGRVYAALMFAAAGATIGVAIRQLYIQSLPPGSVPVCGASLKFMMKVLPLTEVVSKVLNGSGECAKVTWRFLGLAMPAWVLIAAAGLGGFGLWANLRAARADLHI
jgi:protein dithiol:quinone oxidoreductase